MLHVDNITVLRTQPSSAITHSSSTSPKNIVQQYCECRYVRVYKFSVFMKMGNFACINIRVLSIFDSLGIYKSNFRGVHIFADI